MKQSTTRLLRALIENITSDNIKINDTAKRGATLVHHGNVLPIYILADDERRAS